jgi:glucose-6-phosphate 1-dehydrogenase
MAFDLVFFGGTGDLVWRKLMPALFQAFRHDTLPEGGRIIGVGRDELSDEQYRQQIQSRFEQVEGDKRPKPEEFDRFASLLCYVRMDLSKPQAYTALSARLAERQTDTVVMYLSTAPSLFTTVCEQLAAHGLNTPQTRIVLEKPLGHDLASNRAINEAVGQVFKEQQIFRIDHYLGKPAVQNLFAMRFGNALFEPLWRREHIANIQITMAEELGVEKRGGFYDATGALRDMVQNHALQLLCAIAMEPPINAHADAIRDEKLKVLRALKRWTPDTLSQHVMRGQYSAGNLLGQAVPAYRDETGVSPSSNTETFVALRTEIANWRWAGVPFYIRTGKRMAAREAASRSTSAPHRTKFSKAPWAMPTSWSSTCNPKTAWSCTCWPKGKASAAKGSNGATLARCTWTWTLTNALAASEWALTNACCSMCWTAA